MEGINRRLSMGSDLHLKNLLQRLWGEYNEVLAQEELFWRQKARCDWARFGDRNTRFFHTTMITSRKRNKIEALTTDDGTMITDQRELKRTTVDYFHGLYEATGNLGSLTTTTNFPRLERIDLDVLEGAFNDLEIREAIFMGPLKAPSPNGLQPIFFHSQWDIIGPSVCELVHQVYSNPDMIRGLNETLVVLIPKVQQSKTLKQFRPISLCNVVYKIVNKVIANRMRCHMASIIAPHQCSFVPG